MLVQFGLSACLMLAGFGETPKASGEAQWGGPKQDFKVRTRGLAESWPESGPRTIWSRELGMGYSAILADGGRLYTMYRNDGNEVIACLDASNGTTIWEYSYEAPVAERHEHAFNDGPRGAPLLFGGRIYAIGCAGKMNCVEASTGKKVWSHDLWKDFEGSFLNHGYSSSPFGYKDTVIAMVGGEGHSLIAFDKATGEVRWKRLDYKNSYSTPKLIDVSGQDQLLCFMAQELVAVDPKSGNELWKYEIGNQWNQNISLPVWGSDNILFISVEEDGSRGLQLTRKGDKTEVKELWTNNKLRIHHCNAIRVGQHVYTSTGGMGRPGVFWAVDVKTGEVAWKERGFDKATCLFADGRFILLDENGNLGIATATPELFQIHCKAPVLEPMGNSKTWTVPTLDGTTLYVRDCKTIKALDLGVTKSAKAE